MFSPEDLQSLDRNYFSVIVADEYDVTIMSRNTGHFWYLHNPEYPEKGTIILFHKHKADDKYHLHGTDPTAPFVRFTVRGTSSSVLLLR